MVHCDSRVEHSRRDGGGRVAWSAAGAQPAKIMQMARATVAL